MSENLRMYTKAIYGFDHVVRSARPTDWDRASPCDGWTARHVVGHVLAIQRYFESAINGASPTMNPMHDPHVHAGDDPAGAWAATRDALLEALDHPDVLHRVVESWNGPKPVDEIIGFNVADTTVHSWDLARAIGGDDRLDLGLVQHALVLVEPIADGMRGPMLFGDRVATPDTADPQSQLLALTGRQP